MNSAINPRNRLRIQSIANPESARILVLSIVNPHLERNGAATVTRGLLKLLEMPPFRAQVECVPVRAEPLRWRRLAHARSLIDSSFRTLPAKVSFQHSADFRERVRARLRNEHYDLVVLNGSDLLWISEYLPASIPRVLVAHNIEHLLFDSQIQNLSRWYRPLQGLLRKDCQRLQDFELKGIRHARNVVFLSHQESRYAGRLCGGLRSTTIPPVFDYEPGRRPGRKPGPVLEIGYLGNFRWWPNQLGLQWFTNEVLPYVKSPIRLNLFGNGSGRRWRDDRRVVGHGLVDGLERVWASCDLMICPAFSGGGVCVKLAEAAYNGMPVVANRHAVRGLPPVDDPALALLDEPGEWIELLNSTAARDLAGRQGSDKTAAMFAIHSHKDRIQRFFEATINSTDVPEDAADHSPDGVSVDRGLAPPE